jgi:hypothetical protein
VAGSIRYPDAFVVCGSAQPGVLVVTEPVVVFPTEAVVGEAG